MTVGLKERKCFKFQRFCSLNYISVGDAFKAVGLCLRKGKNINELSFVVVIQLFLHEFVAKLRSFSYKPRSPDANYRLLHTLKLVQNKMHLRRKQFACTICYLVGHQEITKDIKQNEIQQICPFYHTAKYKSCRFLK